MFGKGLIKGLQITIKRFFSKNVTQKYPEVKPSLPERSFGSFDFDAAKCISCNLCANACPNRTIKVDSHKDEQGKRVLDQYRLNIGYCMFCRLCIEACPTAALKSKTDFELACFGKDAVVLCWDGNNHKNEVEKTMNADDKAASGLQGD
jgi:NADH-quinone oxidoreductase subunit I